MKNTMLERIMDRPAFAQGPYNRLRCKRGLRKMLGLENRRSRGRQTARAA